MEPTNQAKKRKELIKKGIVITGFFLIFLGVIYVIFKPSAGEQMQRDGMNTEFPDAEKRDLPEKLENYRMGTLSDGNGAVAVASDEVAAINEGDSTNYTQSPGIDDKLSPEAKAFKEAKQMQSSFIEDAMNRKIEREQEEVIRQLEADNRELREQLSYAERNTSSNAYDRMVEKAIEAMNRQGEAEPQKPQPSLLDNNTRLEQARLERPEKELVSSLSKDVVQENNFRSVSVRSFEKSPQNSNTIRAVVAETKTLMSGDFIRLRLMEDVHFADVFLPRRSVITAKATLDGSRMLLRVTSVANKGKIVAVKLSAFDTDAQEGVNIPSSIEREAVKEAGAEVAAGAGENFTFAQGATDQIISEAARTLIQGGSRYLQKKIALPRVTIKAGYNLYLVENEN